MLNLAKLLQIVLVQKNVVESSILEFLLKFLKKQYEERHNQTNALKFNSACKKYQVRDL